MHKKTKIVLLIGAPSTGKTSVLNKLSDLGYVCYEEVSREIIQEARRAGITHLFRSDPLMFSQKLLEKRRLQFEEASVSDADFVFIDRGLPDITAYLDMVNTDYPDEFLKANTNFKYDSVFWFPLWDKIYTLDKERYEDFNLAINIEKHLIKTYTALNYELVEMPKLNLNQRIDFLLTHLKNS